MKELCEGLCVVIYGLPKAGKTTAAVTSAVQALETLKLSGKKVLLLEYERQGHGTLLPRILERVQVIQMWEKNYGLNVKSMEWIVNKYPSKDYPIVIVDTLTEAREQQQTKFLQKTSMLHQQHYYVLYNSSKRLLDFLESHYPLVVVVAHATLQTRLDEQPSYEIDAGQKGINMWLLRHAYYIGFVSDIDHKVYLRYTGTEGVHYTAGGRIPSDKAEKMSSFADVIVYVLKQNLANNSLLSSK